MGFQNFPTKLTSNNLSEINILKKEYPNLKVCYTDHLPFNHKLVYNIVLYAFLAGADFCEKHVVLDSIKKYKDYESGIFPKDFIKIEKKLNFHHSLFFKNKVFYQSELEYRSKFKKYYFFKNNYKKNKILSKRDIVLKKNKFFNFNTYQLDGLKKLKLSKDVFKDQFVGQNCFYKVNLGIIVLSRLESSRLPNKAKLKIGNLSLIEILIHRLKKSNFNKKIIVATHKTKQNIKFYSKIAKKHKVKFFYGNKNPTYRLLEAAKKFKLTDIARVTADDVFRCVETIDRLAKIHIDNSSLATLSKGLPYGCNTEVINVKYLEDFILNTSGLYDIEHLEEFIKFPNIIPLECKINKFQKYQNLRLTIDYQFDFNFFQAIIKHSNYNYQLTLAEIIKIIEKHNLQKKYKKKLEDLLLINSAMRKNLKTSLI